MNKINLDDFLIKLGSEKLSIIYGKDRLKTIMNILDIQINEIKIVDLLKKRYGTQILSVKIIRAYIINSLNNSYVNFLYNGNFVNQDISIDIKKRLIDTNWDRRTGSVQRLIKIFNLDDDFLPPIPVKKDSNNLISPKHNLFDHQKRIKDDIIKNFKENNLKMIVNMPTGAGKTRTTFESLADIWRTRDSKNTFILWIANSEELCEQAFETLEKIWEIRGEEKLNLYRLWGDYFPLNEEFNNGFIIASFKKLYSMLNTQHNNVFELVSIIKNNLKVIVVDEAHQSIARTYQEVLDYISDLDSTTLLGLTATPGRGWDEEENYRLANYYNNKIISIRDENNNIVENPVKYLQDKEYLAYVKTEEIKTNIQYQLSSSELNYLNNNLELSDSFLSKLGEDQTRNLCIFAQIMNHYQNKKSILVFACSLNHSSLLNEICNLNNISSRSIDKDTSLFNRRKFIDEYKNKEIKVLFNYGVLTTGFDAPNTDVVIIARPTRSPVLYNQMIGRGIRGPKVKGNKECIVVDIQDNIVGMPNERGTFNMFKKYYT